MRHLAMLLIVAVGTSGALVAQDFDRVRLVSRTATYEKWRIDRPNVKQPATDYKRIQFRPNDRVRITAGGCVQTGGHGSTWKRYLRPSGPNSDRLYYGVLHKPANCGEGGVVRLSSIAGQWLQVPPDSKAADCFGLMHLRLGYVDDDYGDNGYWGHDDGTENQCRGVGPAWVIVEIQHAQ